MPGAPESSLPADEPVSGAPESSLPADEPVSGAPESSLPADEPVSGAPESSLPADEPVPGAAEVGGGEPMAGGRFAQPVRRGETVVRQLGPPNTRALLQHLADSGFDLAPRFLGTTDDGTQEILSFIPGATGYPPLTEALRSDEALVSVARAIRRFHDASVGFVPPEPGEWRDLEVATPVRIDCVGHHDLAPWNLVFAGTEVTGIIDWDSARPSNRAWDLSYAAHQFVPFHPPAWLEPFGWSTEPDRAARLRLFCASYGAGIEPAEILDLVVIRLSAFAAHQAAEIRAGNPAYAVHAAEDHPAGFRASAQWILEHRADLLR